MLTDDDYQLIKVSMLTAADAAARVANSNQTVYYDEEAFARVYEALTTLKHHCIRVFSELDLFRAMYREQVAAELRSLMGENDDAGNSVGVVSEVSRGGATIQAGDGAGNQPAAAAAGVEATGSKPPAKTKRPYRRRNKGGVSEVPAPVESSGGADEVGGQATA